MSIAELLILLASELNEGKIKPDSKVCIAVYDKNKDTTTSYVAQDVESVPEDNQVFLLSF